MSLSKPRSLQVFGLVFNVLKVVFHCGWAINRPESNEYRSIVRVIITTSLECVVSRCFVDDVEPPFAISNVQLAIISFLNNQHKTVGERCWISTPIIPSPVFIGIVFFFLTLSERWAIPEWICYSSKDLRGPLEILGWISNGSYGHGGRRLDSSESSVFFFSFIFFF